MLVTNLHFLTNLFSSMSTIKKLTKILAMAWLLSGISGVAFAQANPQPLEGLHYETITPAQPNGAPAGKIEIVELFWYGCPHCFRFQPYMEQWIKEKPDNVVLTRVPSLLNSKWEPHARFYYAAQALGVLDKLHGRLFTALHEKRRRLYKEQDLIDFAQSQGVDREQFAKAYRSFAVSVKVQRAQQYGQAVGLSGVPSIVVGGQFLTSGKLAGSFENMIYLMNWLPKQIDTANPSNLNNKPDTAALPTQPH